MKSKLASFLATFGFALVTLSVGWQMYLSAHYLRVAPDHPEPKIGRTYPLIAHKQVVYLTEAENDRVNGPWSSVMVVGIGIFAAAIRIKEKAETDPQ